MKRGYYLVKSYDGVFMKSYTNYQNAYNRCRKLIADDKDCGIYTYNENYELICIIGC